MISNRYLERFSQIVNQSGPLIDIAEAALIIAADEYPDLDIDHYLEQLNLFAEQVRPRVEQSGTPRQKIKQLNQFLFQELDFRGNRENYYDPRNSYLNDVIDRRVGLPITLSLVYLEIGSRLNMPIHGVGLPGHFVVKWRDAREELFIDPFNGGRILDQYELLELIQDTYHAGAQLRPEWLEPVGARYILTRMLNNLREVFVQAENWERALATLEKLLILNPYSEQELRDAGLIAYRLGQFRRAAEYLEEYLLRHSEARDAVHVRTYLRTIWTAIGRLN